MSFFEGGPQAHRIYGVVVGIVVDNKHPDGDFRVKVKFPWLRESDPNYTMGQPDEEDFVSTWARVMSLWAGAERGSFILPEVDDEVLCVFEHGDIRRPFVIGAVWNGVDVAAYDNLSQDGKNDYTSMLTRSGHVLQFVDMQDQEKIVLQTKIGPTECLTDHKSRDGHFICIDHSNGAEKIEIYDRIQKNYVLIDSTNNKITMESKDGDVLIQAGKTVTVKAGTDFLIEAGSNGTVKTGQNYKMNAGSAAEHKSGANTVIKGAQVLIN